MKFSSLSRMLKKTIALALIAVLICVLPSFNFTHTANAFMPTFTAALLLANSPLSSTHTSMSFQTISDFDKQLFSVTEITPKMTDAANEISAANAEVDDPPLFGGTEFNKSASHFDGENFMGSQNRLVSFKTLVRDNLNLNKIKAARKSLGKALHPLQDFYSHSNWIEKNNLEPWAVLGVAGNVLNNPSPSIQTCTDCARNVCADCLDTLTATILTTGYYGGDDRPKPNPFKCSHGGTVNFGGRDTSGLGEISNGINKDTRDCEASPHYNLHGKAAKVAKLATSKYLEEIRTLVGDAKMKLLLGGKLTKAFAIDTTGSMSARLEAVKREVIKIVDSQVDSEIPIDYVLVAINDPAIQVVVVTEDPIVFKASLNSLTAIGGGDTPEPIMGGMLKALTAAEGSGDMYVFANSSPKDKELKGEVLRVAQTRGVKIHMRVFRGESPNGDSTACSGDYVVVPNPNPCPGCLTYYCADCATGDGAPGFLYGDGNCYRWGSRRQFKRRNRTELAFVKPKASSYSNFNHNFNKLVSVAFPQTTDEWAIDGDYADLAAESGGEAFALWPLEANNIFSLSASDSATQDEVNLLAISDTATSTPRTYSVSVDSTMSKVTFSVSGTRDIVLKRPDGTTVPLSGANIERSAVSGGVVTSLTNPSVGAWQAIVRGNGNFSLKVTGRSPLNVSTFNFVKLGGRPLHGGFFPITGSPVSGQQSKATVHASSQGAGTIRFELRSLAGTTLQTPNFEEILWPTDDDENPVPVMGPYRQFVGDVNVPNTPFQVYAIGQDTNGNPFQRLIADVIKPQSIRVIVLSGGELQPNQTTTFTFEVKNFGSTDSFKFAATDEEGYIQGITPTTFTLGANETVNIAVQLKPPTGARPLTSDEVTVSVESTTNLNIRNSATVEALVSLPDDVSENAPPNTNQASPSVAKLWPPNHSVISVSIQGITDPDGDPIAISIDRIMQDEPTNGNGDGNTCPDSQGINSAVAQLRAERKGNGNGRVYTIFFTATDGRGGSTQGSVKVSAPKNQNSTSVDDGPTYDSTACP